MSALVELTPLGTARSRFGEPAAGLAFPGFLRAAVAEYDLPAETVSLAWEIARLARGLSPEQGEALLVLALATLIAARQGSTRVPLADAPEEDRQAPYLESLARRLGLEPEKRVALSALLAQSRLPGGGPAPGVLGVSGDYAPLILDGTFLYQQRMLFYEDRLSGMLGARLRRKPLAIPGTKIKTALGDLLARPPEQAGAAVELSEEQQSAIRAALTSALTVISGGPGTGKTSIVLSNLRALVRLGVPVESIALAAPTGKAAKRLEESIRKSLLSVGRRDGSDEAILAGCPKPRTLHRLLGFYPSSGRFRHHENNRLSEKVVIVDECSMIDLFLMDQLVRSVADDARLILLGDADQLPSVEAGAVFRDLLPPEHSIPADPRRRAVVRLTKNYRMDPSDPAGRAILTAARVVNSGNGEALFTAEEDEDPLVTERLSAEDLAFQKIELLDGIEKAALREAFLDRWYAERVRGLPDFDRLTHREYRQGPAGFSEADRADIARLQAHFDSLRLLCVTRSDARPTGAEAVNAVLHARALASRPAGDADAFHGRPAFLPGEPVMMLRNDYEREIFNGDQGIVLRVAEPGAASHRFMAVFPRDETFAAFHLDALRSDLELSYATTVHKAQGSEYDHVGLVLPETDLPLLTRELLYTALTRSRRSVVILGEKGLLQAAAKARIRRSSGIGEKLLRAGDLP
jgi:exodeoxyribonuclease V alpha subunit